MKTTAILAAATLAVGSLAFVGCDRDDTAKTTVETRTTTTDNRTAGEKTENALERSGAAINNAADKTGDALQRAADKTGDAVGRAADKTGDAVGHAVDKTTEVARTAGEKTADAVNRAAATTVPSGPASAAPDSAKIREVLAEAVDAALSKNGFDNLTERFYSGDRDRLGKYADQANIDALNTQIDQIQTAWKAKYGKDFDLKDNRENALNPQFALVTEGVLADSARLAGEKIGEGATRDAKRDANTIRSTYGADAASSDVSDLSRVNASGSRRAAAVSIPASHGLPPVIINVYHEGLLRGYKLDVPDRMDGARLHANLLKQLTAVNNAKDKWPADATEAYRIVTHHVLLALQDSDASAAAN